MENIPLIISICVIICLADTHGAIGVQRRGLTRPKTLDSLSSLVGDETETTATGDNRRRQTRPKILGVVDDATDDANGEETALEPSQGGARLRTRSRPKRSYKLTRPKRWTDRDVLAPASDVLQRLGILENRDIQSEVKADRLRSRILDTEVLVRTLWQEFCNRDGLVFDPKSISCRETGNAIVQKGWGNQGGLPGK